MNDFKEFSDVFVIKKERDDYVIKKYIGDVKGDLIIPEGVTKISNDAFEYSWIRTYPEITKIVFPKTLKKIPNCFSSWKNLKEIEIPEGVTTISDSAFFDTGLKTVWLPSTIVKIGKSAFSFCEDLKNSESITRFGKIIADNNGFAVKFCEPALGLYDKQGFKTREDAVAYEQDILDKHLAEYMTVKN